MHSMFGFLLVLGLGAAAVAYRQSPEDIAGDLPAKLSSKLDKLWEIAQESLKAQKYLRAEKALLTILRIDAKNTNAYNRLGILYAKQHAYDDAIECFEIAQSLEPSASSLHNVGLIYYETESYEKAALAFEQALEMEEEVASRHIAYAKDKRLKVGGKGMALTGLVLGYSGLGTAMMLIGIWAGMPEGKSLWSQEAAAPAAEVALVA